MSQNLSVCEIVVALEYTRERIVRLEKRERRQNLSPAQREGLHKLRLKLETQWDAWQAAFDSKIPFTKETDTAEAGL